MNISNHVRNRCIGRLAGLVEVEEIEAKLANVEPVGGETWVKIKELTKRVRLQDNGGLITGDIVWVVCRGNVATTVFIRRSTQSVKADRIIGD